MVRRSTLACALSVAFASPAWGECRDLLPGAAEAAMERRRVTAEDLIELREIGVPDPAVESLPSPLALSPDGQFIAFVLNRANLAINGYCRAVVIIPTTGRAAPRIVDEAGELILTSGIYYGLRIVTGFPALVAPQWSPDGRWLVYLKRVDGITQLWRVRADGSASAAITKSRVDIERWRWAADGRHLIVSSRPRSTAVNDAVGEEAKRGFLYDDRFRPHAAPRPQLRVADMPEEYFRIDPLSGRTEPAGQEDVAALLSATEIGVTARDGRRAGADHETPSPYSATRVWAEDRVGHKVTCAADACREGILDLWWADDGSLVFLRREGWAQSSTAIYRWSPGEARPKRLWASADWLLGCLYRHERLFCTRENSITPRHIVSIDLSTGKSALLFDPNPGFKRLAVGKVERLTWRNDIGLPAWGDLVLPPDYRSGSEKLPLVIVQYHSDGFLRGGTGDAHPIFLLAASGFAVLSVERTPFYGADNPSLTTADAIVTVMTNDWAERRSLHSSLLAGMDRAVARGVVDPARVGITGLSDGASATAFALINSDRFRAASISTCCDEPRTVMAYGGPAWAAWNRSVRKYPLTTEPDDEFWMPMSLSLNARRIDTPLLMQLADREYLLGLESFTALREQGKPVEMYVFPDEYHIRVHPVHRRAEYEREIDWFRFWLQGAEDPAPAKQGQYERWRAMRAAAEERP